MGWDLSDIKLSDLSLLVELQRHGSVRAVSRHRRTQPSQISKSLAKLELRTGQSLVERSKKGVLLNRTGLQLAELSKRILNDLAENTSPEAEKLLESKTRFKSGCQFGIGSVSFFVKYLLAPSLSSMNDILPGYRFRILEMPPDQAPEAALKGAFESIVHINELNLPRSWSSFKIGKIRWGLYGKANHPLISKYGPVVSAKAIQNFPFVVPTYWSNQEFLIGNDLCPLDWNRRIKGYEASAAASAAIILEHTDHLAFLPSMVAYSALKHSLLTELIVEEWPEVVRDVYLSVNGQKIQKSNLSQIQKLLQRRLALFN